MTLTFPRTMPTRGFAEVEFELRRFDVTAPEQGGRLVSVALGVTGLWKMRVRTATLGMDLFGEWRAFLDSLRGSSRLFYGLDTARRFPITYPSGFTGLNRAGGGSFDGTATSWSVNTPRDDLTLNGLPASFRIKPGDMVGFSWSTSKRSLHRALEDVTANGSGVATFNVEPPVQALVSGSAVATLAQPTATMRLIPGSVSIASQMHRSGAVSFEALQHLEA